MSKKVCKECKLFVDDAVCPQCHGSAFTSLFQGKISIIDPKHSEIAKRMSITYAGDYAIKVK